MSEASLHFPDGFTVLQYKLEVHSLTPSFSEIKELLLFFPSKNTLLLLTPELIYVGWHRISHFRNLVQNNILTLPFWKHIKLFLHRFVQVLKVAWRLQNPPAWEINFSPTFMQCLHVAGTHRHWPSVVKVVWCHLCLKCFSRQLFLVWEGWLQHMEFQNRSAKLKIL